MSLPLHSSKGGQHGDLGADVNLPELTHPSQDTNQVHEISSHRGLKPWGNILFRGIITREENLPLRLFLRYFSTFLTAC
jgi:hypothetical protein